MIITCRCMSKRQRPPVLLCTTNSMSVLNMCCGLKTTRNISGCSGLKILVLVAMTCTGQKEHHTATVESAMLQPLMRCAQQLLAIKIGLTIIV